MLGVKAILQDIGFVLLGLFLCLGSWWSVVSSRRVLRTGTLTKRALDNLYGSIAVAALGSIFLAMAGQYLVWQILFHSHLRHLVPEVVQTIEVGSKVVTDRLQIAEVIRALQEPEWFELQRGDAGDKVPFVIQLSNGCRYNYSVSRYQHGQGAALISQTRFGMQNGQVLCRRLAEALARTGIVLPNCYTYGGKPLHCAQQ
jgi:hypothetical protein